MFIQPIISACTAFDAGLLTGLIVGMTILKCMFASLVGGIIAYIGIFVGGLLISFGDNSRYKKFTRKYRKN